MNTKIIMTLSAIALGAIGISLTFLPNEIAAQFCMGPMLPLVMQLLGGLYFAFAMLNWMAKGSLIGGIYNRPVSVANFTHFFIGALALLKGFMNNHNLPVAILALTVVYAIFAVLFGLILFRHPGKQGVA